MHTESPTPMITRLQYLQLLGLFVLAERAVRQINETRAAALALLRDASAADNLDDMISDEMFGTANVDQLLEWLGVMVEVS